MVKNPNRYIVTSITYIWPLMGDLEFGREGTPSQMWWSTPSTKLLVCPSHLDMSRPKAFHQQKASYDGPTEYGPSEEGRDTTCPFKRRFSSFFSPPEGTQNQNNGPNIWKNFRGYSGSFVLCFFETSSHFGCLFLKKLNVWWMAVKTDGSPSPNFFSLKGIGVTVVSFKVQRGLLRWQSSLNLRDWIPLVRQT